MTRIDTFLFGTEDSRKSMTIIDHSTTNGRTRDPEQGIESTGVQMNGHTFTVNSK